MRLRKRWFWLLLMVLIAGGAAIAPAIYRTALLGSGFMAQLLCSSTFVSRRDPQSVLNEDMKGPGYELLWFFQPRIERTTKRVSASMYGLGRRTAVFREELGCTLAVDRTEDELQAETTGISQSPPLASSSDALWPEGERIDLDVLPQEVDHVALEAGVEAAFAEPDPTHPRRTRALVVVHAGRVVAERYAPGFDAATPLIGWSMTKLALNTLVGLAVQDGKLTLADKALLPEWRGDTDARRDITLDQLLRLTSGLSFSEDYRDHASDVIQMLFMRGDKAGFAASKPLRYPPGTHWSYSSGASNIIARILRQSFADERDYLRFPRKRLFEPLGMRSAVLEPDEVGTFVGSTFMYASARDWARLGLLFLRDGMWQGRRLLPKGWVASTLIPTREVSNGSYGAHVWLKLPESPGLGEPPMPENAYYILGHDQQIVAIVPSRDLVIVRLGLTREKGNWDHARDLAPIVQAFPAKVEIRQ